MLMVLLMAVLSVELVSGNHTASNDTTHAVLRNRGTRKYFQLSNFTKTSMPPNNTSDRRISIHLEKQKQVPNNCKSEETEKPITSPKRKKIIRKKRNRKNTSVENGQEKIQAAQSDPLVLQYAPHSPATSGLTISTNGEVLGVGYGFPGTLPTLPPPLTPIPPYRTLPQGNDFLAERPNFNWITAPRLLHEIPRPPRKYPERHRPQRLPIQRVTATLKPIPIIQTALGPARSVTHVFKYADNSVPVLNFLDSDDDIVVPAISAALEEHGKTNVPNYLTPPRLNQPMTYDTGLVTLPTLPTISLKDLEAISKFNEALKARKKGSEESGEKYNEEDILRAMKYLKRRKKKKKNKKEEAEEESGERKKKKKHKEYSMEDKSDELAESKKESEKENHGDEEDEANEKDKIKSLSEELDIEESNRKTSTLLHIETTTQNIDNNDDLENEEFTPHVATETLDPHDHSQNIPPDFSHAADMSSKKGERVEFQMHGLKGAESYKFGYDTGGKGENRQFRYEERDGDGNIKGHYGYYDGDGRLRVFNYAANHNGYQLEQGQ